MLRAKGVKTVKSLGFKTAAAVLSLTLLLLVAEVLVRLLVPPAYWVFRDAAADWELDPRLGWVQKPNMNVAMASDQGWLIEFTTNEDGVAPASAERRRTPGVLRVMVFGDSVVVGRALPADQRIEAALTRLLAQSGLRVEVFNAGVEGYSTDQALLRMQDLLPKYRPDVVLYGLCTNDFGGNLAAEAYGLSKPRFVMADDGSLIRISPRPNQTVPRAGGWKSIPQHWAVYRLLQPSILAVRARFGGWSERNLLGLASEMYYRQDALDQVDWKLLGALLREMKDEANVNGARFLFFAHPAIEEVWRPYIQDTVRRLGLRPEEYDPFAVESRLGAVAAETGVAFVPLVRRFQENQDRGPFHLLPRDPHCNAAGYLLSADILAPEIRKRVGESSQ